MRISDWSSDVCSSDLDAGEGPRGWVPGRWSGLLARGLGGTLDGFLGLGLDLGGGRLDLGLGDLGDGFVGLQGAAEHFLAGADGALDVLARNLRTLRPRGLKAVERKGVVRGKRVSGR